MQVFLYYYLCILKDSKLAHISVHPHQDEDGCGQFLRL